MRKLANGMPLEAEGTLDNTIIFFLSDYRPMLRQNRAAGKLFTCL